MAISKRLRYEVFRRDNYTLTDDIHFLMGKHNIDAGFHGEVSKVDVNNLFEQPGQFNFASNANAFPSKSPPTIKSPAVASSEE